jgi:RNA polymerase sigma factor (sigma-70 family)
MTHEQLLRANLPLAAHFVHTRHFWPPPGTDWEDLIQAARIALWEAAQKWDPSRGQFADFACGAMKRYLIDYTTQHTRRARRWERYTEAYEQPQEMDTEERVTVRAAWERLEERDREILSLVVEGWELREIAAQWGVTRACAESRIRQARLRARKELAG